VKHLCQGHKSVLGNQLLNNHSKKVLQEFRPHWFNNGTERPVGIKRIRMICPVCKRRIKASVSTCEDGCCLYFTIPPHKPKKWWKQKRAKWNPKKKS
jgi:hypothetical protein